MTKTIGIPRGLFYYKYFPLWEKFFNELEVKVVVSGPTTKQILNEGVKSCVDEACLPVKIFYGHVLDLKEKVDYIFIPRFTSISKNEYVCPKFGGLPDMVRHGLKGLPQIIDTEINMRKSKSSAIKAFYEIGAYFNSDRGTIKRAYREALKSYEEFLNKTKEGVIPFDTSEKRQKKQNGNMLDIMLIGHAYNLYDRFINMDIIKKLREANINVITIDMVDEEIVNKKVEALPKRMFWNFGRQAVGSAIHIIDEHKINGIIYLMSFGCGVDSFVGDLVERKVRRGTDIPYITLTLDEHSGQEGMNTRLEAFIDMIRWRNANENNISAFG